MYIYKYLRPICRKSKFNTLVLISQKMSLATQSKLANLDEIRTKPFIVICGCTGTGKTKLSIELAEWLSKNNKNAEIINADAMQVIKLCLIKKYNC